ncbi:MAG: FAD-dependent oxidoreductase [Planctomycetota bacterium]|jgi:kynurenine 3-monooxygenase
MTDQTQHDFTILGAGLAGALMSVYLARAGKTVTLFERRPDPRVGTPERGRSINLAFSTRGITALKGVGLHTKVLDESIPMRGRMIHNTNSTTVFQPYSHNPEHAINSISRAGLNNILIQAADEEPNVSIQFASRCTHVDIDSKTATIANSQTGETRQVPYRCAIGADGAFSSLRAAMQPRDRFSYSQSYLPHGYKEFTIPPTASGEFALEPEALHIWPRGGFMLIALPNADKSFTATLFWPHDGPIGPEGINTSERAQRFFERNFPDALSRMPDMPDDFEHNPHSSLCTVRCDPWHVRGDAVLIGDAAHAVVPFYGQGMNCAFEDCRVLADTLRSFNYNTEQAFPAFTAVRVRHANALADLAIKNYEEMRDHVNSPLFRARKWLERTAARWLPSSWYTSLYEMISFSNVPYADAVDRDTRQARIALAIALLALFILLLVIF